MSVSGIQEPVLLYDAFGVPIAESTLSNTSQELTRIRRMLDRVELKLAEGSSTTSWFSSSAPSLGQELSKNSIPTVLASDQSPVPTTGYSAVPSAAYAVTKFGRQTYGAATAGTLQDITSTAFVEQTSGAQRSFSSASANDTAAGTGARTIELTFLDDTWIRHTEIITLAGTSAVNTVSRRIQYVESIRVVSAGSLGDNAGVISMFAAAAGAGGTIASIGFGGVVTAIGDNETFYGHHYIPRGKIGRVSTMTLGTAGSAIAAYMFMRTRRLDVPGSAEVQCSPFAIVTLPYTVIPTSGTICVPGPAALIMYAIPTVDSQTVFVSYDVVEL